MAGKRVCAEKGCPVLVSGDTRCPDHQPKASPLGWTNDAGRMRGRRLQQARSYLFAAEPVCRLCSAKGRLSLATIRDHILPLAEGGTDDPENIQPLCEACSREKSAAEALRGRRRTG